MKMLKKFISVLMVLVMAFCTLISGNISGDVTVKASAPLGSNDFLKVKGTQIRKAKGNGDVVYLRGTNAGGWLVQEKLDESNKCIRSEDYDGYIGQ